MRSLYTPYAITVSDFASGPPSSPSSGDIWVGTNVDANGTRWQFQYNAGSASTYKWEFIGGAPFAVSTVSLSAWGSLNVWNAFPNLGGGYTAGRSGEYLAQGSFAGIGASGAGTIQLGFSIGGGTPGITRSVAWPSTSYGWFLGITPIVYTVTSGNSIDLKYNTNATPYGFSGAEMSLIPRRVS